MKQSVLVIGSGGREHALAKAFASSEKVEQVFVIPGNPGMETTPNVVCVDLDMSNFSAVMAFAKEKAVAFTFVGPEVPLSQGIVDAFRQEQLKIVGPTQYASQLEASKSFAKDVMKRAGVPTASYQSFDATQLDEATAYLSTQKVPIVIKQDGLAAGKGVVIAQTLKEAHDTLHTMMVEQNSSVVIEEFLVGEEFSFFSLVNGTHVIPIGFARDYKRAYDNDEGLNTGGMGAFSPLKWVDDTLKQEALSQVVQPLVNQMVKDGEPYTGILYSGLMHTQDGIKVIEFNARFGDPETQILLPMLETDLYDIVQAHLTQETIEVQLKDGASLGVILAAKGYPQAHQKGMAIDIPADFPVERLCFAGVAEEQGRLVATGGRILMVTSQQPTLAKCRQEVYDLLNQLAVPNTFYRQDIGKNAKGGVDDGECSCCCCHG